MIELHSQRQYTEMRLKEECLVGNFLQEFSKLTQLTYHSNFHTKNGANKTAWRDCKYIMLELMLCYYVRADPELIKG